ncbi:MAG: Inner membrane protein of type IV secretion of T-DNA complex, VirB6, partial [uncultured Sphingomonas sp.]
EQLPDPVGRRPSWYRRSAACRRLRQRGRDREGVRPAVRRGRLAGQRADTAAYLVHRAARGEPADRAFQARPQHADAAHAWPRLGADLCHQLGRLPERRMDPSDRRARSGRLRGDGAARLRDRRLRGSARQPVRRRRPGGRSRQGTAAADPDRHHPGSAAGGGLDRRRRAVDGGDAAPARNGRGAAGRAYRLGGAAGARAGVHRHGLVPRNPRPVRRLAQGRGDVRAGAAVHRADRRRGAGAARPDRRGAERRAGQHAGGGDDVPRRGRLRCADGDRPEGQWSHGRRLEHRHEWTRRDCCCSRSSGARLPCHEQQSGHRAGVCCPGRQRRRAGAAGVRPCPRHRCGHACPRQRCVGGAGPRRPGDRAEVRERRHQRSSGFPRLGGRPPRAGNRHPFPRAAARTQCRKAQDM